MTLNFYEIETLWMIYEVEISQESQNSAMSGTLKILTLQQARLSTQLLSHTGDLFGTIGGHHLFMSGEKDNCVAYAPEGEGGTVNQSMGGGN